MCWPVFQCCLPWVPILPLPYLIPAEVFLSVTYLDGSLSPSLSKSQGWPYSSLLLWNIWGQVAETQASLTEKTASVQTKPRPCQSRSPIPGSSLRDLPLVSDPSDQSPGRTHAPLWVWNPHPFLSSFTLSSADTPTPKSLVLQGSVLASLGPRHMDSATLLPWFLLPSVSWMPSLWFQGSPILSLLLGQPGCPPGTPPSCSPKRC